MFCRLHPWTVDFVLPDSIFTHASLLCIVLGVSCPQSTSCSVEVLVYLPCHYKSSWGGGGGGFGLKAPLFIVQLKANSCHKLKFLRQTGSREQRQHLYISKIQVLMCVKCVTTLHLCPSDCVYLASVLLGEVQLTPRFTSFHIKASPSRLQKHLWNVCCFFFVLFFKRCDSGILRANV